MKARLAIAAAVLAIAGAAAVLFARTSTTSMTSTTHAGSNAPPRGAAANRGAVVHVDQRAGDLAAAAPTGPPVKVGAAQRVATVNGVAITGRQLLAWRSGDPSEQEMTPEMFASLKARALDRELTFAEARRQGIELRSDQLGQLKDVRKNAEARGETDVAQLDFEENDARAHMLATTLLEKTGVNAPFVTEADVKRYYDAHADDFDDLPQDPNAREAAWKKLGLEIRQTLSVELQENYQHQLRAYFDKLRATARITD